MPPRIELAELEITLSVAGIMLIIFILASPLIEKTPVVLAGTLWLGGAISFSFLSSYLPRPILTREESELERALEMFRSHKFEERYKPLPRLPPFSILPPDTGTTIGIRMIPTIPPDHLVAEPSLFDQGLAMLELPQGEEPQDQSSQTGEEKEEGQQGQ